MRSDDDLFVCVLLLAADAESVKVSCEEAGQVGSAEDLVHELQKQCTIVSVAQTSQVIPGATTGHLCATTAGMPPNIGISTSEQLRQLLALLSKKSDRQLVVNDELQNSVSKVFPLLFCYFHDNIFLYVVNAESDLYDDLYMTDHGSMVSE